MKSSLRAIAATFAAIALLWPAQKASAYDVDVTVHVMVAGNPAPDGTEVELRYTVEGPVGMTHWEKTTGTVEGGKARLKVPHSTPKRYYEVCASAILPDRRKIREVCSRALTTSIWLFG
jgi:hypothetical protein